MLSDEQWPAPSDHYPIVATFELDASHADRAVDASDAVVLDFKKTTERKVVWEASVDGTSVG